VTAPPPTCAPRRRAANRIRRRRTGQPQEKARRVSDRLRNRLEQLWRTDKLIGAAHGAECTSSRAHRDHVTKESATGETHARCERMLELGVTLRPTSEFDNVLEVKPPLFIGAQDADAFVRALDRVLREGW